MKRQIKNAKLELALNLSLIPIPIAAFIRNGFATKNMGPGGPFLFFLYLTHVKDIAVIAGIAIPDAIRAKNAIKAQNELTSPLSVQEDDSDDYSTADEIADELGSRRTCVRYQVMSLVITADLLFWILVFPALEKPENSLDTAVAVLSVANHSYDALVLFPKMIYNNTPLHTSGTKCQRFLKEYMAPMATDAVYAVTCLFGYQKLGGTDEKGQPLYAAVDFEKDPIGALILCAALAVGMPVFNKMIFLISEAIQFGIHSPAGSVKTKIHSFGDKLSNGCINVGRNIYGAFTGCCRRSSSASTEHAVLRT